jgi:HNH endonuclease
MNKSEYRQYLASEHWLERRKIFLFSHDECERCGIPREFSKDFYRQDLHVHHSNYQHVGRELDDDLEALCARCHEVESTGSSNLPVYDQTSKERDFRERWVAAYTADPANMHMTEWGLAGVFGHA